MYRSRQRLSSTMVKVTFKLKRGFRVGNYELLRRIGAGCTAEAYLAREVPTEAVRVIKFYELYEDAQRIRNLRDFEHYCWLVEQLSSAQILPRYYHMGHAFIRNSDGIGTYYMVQEYLKGTPFKREKCTTSMVEEFQRKVAQVHANGFALGDWSSDNLLITGKAMRMVDCDYGNFDKPNANFSADVKEMKRLFGERSS